MVYDGFLRDVCRKIFVEFLLNKLQTLKSLLKCGHQIFPGIFQKIILFLFNIIKHNLHEEQQPKICINSQKFVLPLKVQTKENTRIIRELLKCVRSMGCSIHERPRYLQTLLSFDYKHSSCCRTLTMNCYKPFGT